MTNLNLRSMSITDLETIIMARSIEDLGVWGIPQCEKCGKMPGITRIGACIGNEHGGWVDPTAPKQLRGRFCIDCDGELYLVKMEIDRREWEAREAEAAKKKAEHEAREREAFEKLNQVPVENLTATQIDESLNVYRNRYATDDRRQAVRDERARREAQAAQKRLEARRNENFRIAYCKIFSQCGRKYIDAAINSFTPASKEQRHALEQLQKWISDPQGAFTLSGPPSTGKTFLAARAFGFTVSRNDWTGEGEFISEPQLLRQWRSAAADQTEFDVELLQNTPLLILDDLGTATKSQGSVGLLFEIIDYRTTHSLPTLITTNLSPSDLFATVGEKVFDRIVEQGPWINLGGESLRRKGLTSH
ncbi:MAG: ATP-binding protein [Phycisphaerales bacterium]|nr:ATP-binding protein [Phycisphaerales bacterium]